MPCIAACIAMQVAVHEGRQHGLEWLLDFSDPAKRVDVEPSRLKLA